jgi:hypothetical protein
MSAEYRYGLTPLGEALLHSIASGEAVVAAPRPRLQAPACPACRHRTFVSGGWKSRRKCVEPGCACRCAEFFEPVR